MTLLLLFAALAIGVSFLCSLLEASLLSLPRSHVEVMVQRGSRIGVMLQRMKEGIDRPLAAILTLNTIAHTVGAAGVGAQAAETFGSQAVGIAGAVMTLAILVFSEIIPKTLGAVHARGLAGATALVTRGMILVCYPLIVVLEWINRLIRRDGGERQVSRDELAATLRLGWQGGLLDRREFRVASNVLALGDVRLEEVMTPRTVVFALPQAMTVEDALAEHQPFRFDRIPVYRDTIDDVTGYVLRFDVREAHTAGRGAQPLAELAKPMQAFPEQASVGDVLEWMLAKREHIVLVVDEHGGAAGIATLEDALETLLGEEIVDETDPAVDMQQLARRLAAHRQRPTSPPDPDTP